MPKQAQSLTVASQCSADGFSISAHTVASLRCRLSLYSAIIQRNSRHLLRGNVRPATHFAASHCEQHPLCGHCSAHPSAKLDDVLNSIFLKGEVLYWSNNLCKCLYIYSFYAF